MRYRTITDLVAAAIEYQNSNMTVDEIRAKYRFGATTFSNLVDAAKVQRRERGTHARAETDKLTRSEIEKNICASGFRCRLRESMPETLNYDYKETLPEWKYVRNSETKNVGRISRYGISPDGKHSVVFVRLASANTAGFVVVYWKKNKCLPATEEEYLSFNNFIERKRKKVVKSVSKPVYVNDIDPFVNGLKISADFWRQNENHQNR